MSGVAIVLSFERVTEDDGTKGSDVKVDPGDQPMTVPHFCAPGVDVHPMPGDSVALSDSAGSGAEQAVGYEDTKNAGLAARGEVRIYARDSGGAPICAVWVKANGSVTITNNGGAFEMAANGNVTINGVLIDTDGNVVAPGEVTAMDGPAKVSLSTHTHPTGVGPSGPSTPGT